MKVLTIFCTGVLFQLSITQKKLNSNSFHFFFQICTFIVQKGSVGEKFLLQKAGVAAAFLSIKAVSKFNFGHFLGKKWKELEFGFVLKQDS